MTRSPGAMVSSVAILAIAAIARAQDPQPPPAVPVLLCGQEQQTTPAPGQYCTIATGQGPAAERAGRAFIETYELGLGKPSCSSVNCGVGQSCPPTGGSQVSAGSITWTYTPLPDGNTEVCADVAQGTITQQHCQDCY